MSQNELLVRAHVLCALCKAFWDKVTCLNSTSNTPSMGGEQVRLTPQYLLHSLHQSQIKSGAASGCHCCSILLASFTGCTGGNHKRESHETDPVYISIDTLNQDDGTFLLTLFPCEQSKIFSHNQILNDFPLRLQPVESKTSSLDDAKATTACNDFQLSYLQTSTFSKTAADFVKSWIARCRAEHPLCGSDHFDMLHGQAQPPMRPRRLLDLQSFQSEDKIKLIEAENDPDLEYCALSYSWGFSTPYLMTSSNLADFQKGISTQDLPKLLRDAIAIIKDIGFRYMWIDALCIMQDGHLSPTASDDWLDQAGKMHGIFGSSAITIAAAEAFDCNQSLIVPRNPLGQINCRLDLETDRSYEVVSSCTPHCDQHPIWNARYHLDTRAWVFQERILSPRTFHITRNFIHLECRTELTCEATSGPATCHHSGAVAKVDYQTLFAIFGLDGLDDFAVDYFLSYWNELIRRYSTTNLSRDSDLLVALAGLARQVQLRSRLTWSFGLWREHLLRGMLWYVRGGTGSPRRERAPTWSWASIEVQGPQITYDAYTKVSLLAEITSLPQESDFARQPPLITEESRYVVRVMGRLRPSNDSPLGLKLWPEHDTRVHRNCQGMLELQPDCPFHPDYQLPEHIELYTLLLALVSGIQQRNGISRSWTTEVGIVLTPVTGLPWRYRRVGYFHHDMKRQMDLEISHELPSLFEHAEIHEIEIV